MPSSVRRPHKRTVLKTVASILRFHSCNAKVYDRMPPEQHLREVHTQRRTASVDSRGGENNSRPGLRSSEPPGFRSNATICQFHAADHGVNARVVPTRGFVCVFQLWVQEGTATPALSASHPGGKATCGWLMSSILVTSSQA